MTHQRQAEPQRPQVGDKVRMARKAETYHGTLVEVTPKGFATVERPDGWKFTTAIGLLYADK